MSQREIHFWKTTVFMTLIITVVLSFILFQKQSNHQDRNLFIVSEPPLIALDHKTFNDKVLFERATLLTAPLFRLDSYIRRFSAPLKSIAAHPMDYERSIIYATQGKNLIKISLGAGADEIYFFEEKLNSPIAGLSFHPVQQQILYALCENNDVFKIDLSAQKPVLQALGKSKIMPEYMTVEDMWPNPFTHHITISYSRNRDTILVDVDPEDWNLSQKEMILTGHVLTGGFYVSKQLQLVADDRYQLHVIDAQKRTRVGQYKPNPHFAYGDLYKTKPIGLTILGKEIFLADNYNSILKLNWSPNKHTIIINREIEIKNGKIALNWKTPQQTRKVLFFAELSLTPPALAAKKQPNLPTAPLKTTIPIGPMEKSSMELPFIETAYRSLDIQLFGIHARSGKLLSPAVDFTIETEHNEK